MKLLALLPSVALVSAAAVQSPPPGATVPDVQTLPPVTRKEAIVKRIRYGPHTLKPATGTAADPKGVKTTILLPSVQKPCEDCTLLSMNGGVQYADGTEATGSAVYLHHAAIINTGPEAKDGTCGRPAYDLFFSTGNERSRIIYNRPDTPQQAGYYIQASDKFLLQSEVVNNEMSEKKVWVYFNYEYIPKKLPNQQQTKVVWLSADDKKPCSTASAISPATLSGVPKDEKELGAGELYPPNDKKFQLKGQPWISPWDGNLFALGGHLHDGGINAEIYLNDKLICDSVANYEVNNKSGMGATPDHHGGVSTASRHISSMSGCSSTAAVKKGDQVRVVVNYDFEKNPGMKDKDNKLLPIMAAATLFIGATN